MPTDFRDGKTFPRPGRLRMGQFMWLARVFDKARASADGTIHDYIYPCPMDRGMFDRWGITSRDFDRAIATHRDDDAILAWAQSTVSDDGIQRANAWLVKEKVENLDRQDREEGVATK
ncbi:MAG: DUF5069 domain-containing protein [Vulcanimicrobiaceae bacterium]